MKQTGLGRGLDALFEDNTTESGDRISQLSAALILPDENQNRSTFYDESLNELADSIRSHGILQPLLVRPDQNGTYRIVAGERRFRAGKLCGLKTFPVIIRDMNEIEAAEMALIENLQREDLNPLDEARGFLRLTQSFGLTQEEAAKRVGKSRAAVANSLRLLKLPPRILDLISDGTLSAGHARAVLSVSPDAKKLLLAQKIVAERLSVRAAEAEAARLMRPEESGEDSAQTEYRKRLQGRLSVRIGRKVQILPAKTGKGGRLAIHYKNTNELEELIASLAGEDFLLNE